MIRTIVSLLFVISLVAAKTCDVDSKVGSVCTLKSKHLRPLQFGYSAIEVTCKKDRLNSMSRSEAKKYLESEKRWVSIVIGPEGYYLLDGHHMSRSVLESNYNDEDIYCSVAHNFHNYPSEQFWQQLVTLNKIWLYDEKGSSPISPEHLADDLWGMIDDPFRTLAWMSQHAGGFLKVGLEFEDFMWANFYRTFINLNDNEGKYIYDRPLTISQTNNNYSKVYTWCEVRPNSPECIPEQYQLLQKLLPQVLNMSVEVGASSLPGYDQGVSDPPQCGDTSKNYEYLHQAWKEVLEPRYQEKYSKH